MKTNDLRIVRILRKKAENTRTTTLFFEDKLSSAAMPGQFVMVWVPGVDEIPLSLSSIGEEEFASVTVAEVGDATRALSEMNQGAKFGIRGPFGNHFEIVGKEALVIGGGSGMASLIGLVRSLLTSKVKTTVIQGAETRGDLLFLDRLEKRRVETLVTTEDGSYGQEGVATDAAERVLSSRKFDVIYSCGPEKMIRKTYFLAKKYRIAFQTCLERLMRCGIGICGSCVVGTYRVCKDGPVFFDTQLEEIQDDLGRYRLGFSGNRMRI